MLIGNRFPLNDSRLSKLMELVHASFRMLDMSGGILNQMPFVRFLAPKYSGYKDIKLILNEFYTFLKVTTFFLIFINHRLRYSMVYEKCLQESVDEHRDKINDQEDFIGAFLMEIEKNRESPKSFSEEQLLVVLLDLFLAGSETTSSMLSFVILLLLRHQDVQAKVRAEIDAVIGDREVRLEDKNK